MLAIHLRDVAIIGLDLSQSHKLGRPKTLPLHFCRVQSSCECCMMSPYTFILRPLLAPQEINPQWEQGELDRFY